MKTTNYKKTLLLKLYLEALIKTPHMYLKEKEDYETHKNTLLTLNTLLFNKQYYTKTFDCLNNQEENDFIKTNIKIYNAYKPYNEYINDIDISDIDLNNVFSIMRTEMDKKENDITYEEMLDLVNDYYNSLPNKKIRQVFNNIYKEKDNNIRLVDDSSYTFLLPSIKYSLISLDIANETYKNMIYDLVHEYGHCIQTNLTHKIDYYDEEYKPVELMPVFFNMLSTFYFDNKKTANTLEKNIALMQTNMFINQIKYTKEIMENGLDSFKEKYNDTAVDIYFEHNLLEIYSYLIPMLTSYELLTNYKKDPEKAMNTLENLVINNDNYINTLDNNNIHLGQTTKEAIKMLKK